ncbi:MAG: methyltransferase domain-containing protein [Methylobacterium frigidaeris]
MDRTEILRAGLSRRDRLIEIGPSYNPLFPKRDGWNVVTVDHLDRDGLLAKYAGTPGVDPDRIEAVDVVWTGGSLAEAFPPSEHGSFDAFVASHVIEHTTDLVGFLGAALRLLKPEGVIVLAVPDKRLCFDAYRPLSTTAEAVFAHREARSRHTSKTLFEYLAYSAKKGDDLSWARADDRPLRLNFDLGGSRGFLDDLPPGEYRDAHAWVMVPASFELMICELSALGLLDCRVARIEPAAGLEFYAWLRRGDGAPDAAALAATRRRLLDRIVVELAEQALQIPESPFHRMEARLRQLEGRTLHGRLRRARAWLRRIRPG